MTMPIIKPKDDTAKYQSECINAVSFIVYKTQMAQNVIAMIIGYKYFYFSDLKCCQLELKAIMLLK